MSLIETSHSPASAQEGMYFLKEALKTNSWSVVKTCDGSSFSAGTDLLTTPSKLAVLNAFFVAVAPNGLEFLFINPSSVWNEVWICLVSPNDGFTGGAVGVYPTATDQVLCLDTTGIFPTGGAFVLQIGVEDQSPYRWYIRGTVLGQDVSCFSIGTTTPVLLYDQTSGGATYYPAPDDSYVFNSLRNILLDTSSGGGGGAVDSITPEISNINPAPGDPVYRFSEVSFRLTDETELKLIEIQVDQHTREVVFDGSTFLYPYLGSTRVEVTPSKSYDYTIRRSTGWITTPTWHLRILDTGFNEPINP